MALLSVEKNEFATVAVLNDPKTRNSMSPTMTEEWVSLLTALEQDPRTRCLIVSGFGKVFSSGGALQWLSEVDPSLEVQQQRMLNFYQDWLSFRRCSFPVICALNGAAVGAAAVFASACDLRVASENASLSVPFTSLGIHPGMATSWFLDRALSPNLSADLLLTGRSLGGDEFRLSGFATQTVSTAELLPTAIKLAKAINRTSQAATKTTLSSIRDPLTTLDASLQRDAARQALTMYDEEFRTRISRLIKR